MSDVTARPLSPPSPPKPAAPAPGPGPGPTLRSLPARLRIVRPTETSPRIRRRRARLAICSLFALVAAGLFGLVALHVVLTQNQFRLDALRTQATTEEAKYERLRLQVAQLESPQRIVAEAQRLGMVHPPSVTYLTPVNPAPGAAESSKPAEATQAAVSDPTGWTEVKPKLAPGR